MCYCYCKNPHAMLNYDLYEILTVYNIGFISVVKCTLFACKILLVLSTYSSNIQNSFVQMWMFFYNSKDLKWSWIINLVHSGDYNWVNWAWICTKSMYLSLQSAQFMPNKQILIGHAKTNYKARMHRVVASYVDIIEL